MKKIINDVENVEQEMIEGLVKSRPRKLEKLEAGNIVVRKERKQGKVALVSGGGSGHEPAHGGYVGRGMLDAAVAGPVFTSPTPDMVYEGIKAVATDAGVLCIVKNYTGDVMNFEMAVDMAKDDDIKADYVVVNDDVAVEDSSFTTGRRGVAGTILVHKIAGARAEEGGTLEEVKAVAEKVIANVRTMGMAIKPCTVPAAGKPGFELPEDEMEIGIGIHGEPGTHREHASRETPEGERDCKAAARQDSRRHRLQRQRGRRHRQRHGRDAAHGALYRQQFRPGLSQGEKCQSL